MNKYNDQKSQGRNRGNSGNGKFGPNGNQPGQSQANEKAAQAGSAQQESQQLEQGKSQQGGGEGSGGNAQASQSIPGDGGVSPRQITEAPEEGQRAVSASEQLEGDDDSDAVEADKSERLNAAFEDGPRNL